MLAPTTPAQLARESAAAADPTGLSPRANASVADTASNERLIAVLPSGEVTKRPYPQVPTITSAFVPTLHGWSRRTAPSARRRMPRRRSPSGRLHREQRPPPPARRRRSRGLLRRP